MVRIPRHLLELLIGIFTYSRVHFGTQTHTQVAEARVREDMSHAVAVARAETAEAERRAKAELDTLKRVHDEQLAALRRQQHDSVYLNSLAKQVSESASSLQHLQSSVARDKTSGERDREAALEVREKMVALREEKVLADMATVTDKDATVQRAARQQVRPNGNVHHTLFLSFFFFFFFFFFQR
jgi:hypothetical protein